ncbi:MAG: phosphoenolpyruvate carboxykinase domain-containing protein [Acidimicrobiales bacterium]
MAFWAGTWPTTGHTGSASPSAWRPRSTRIYSVSWFSRDANWWFLQPGFGENARVLAWSFDRFAGTGEGNQPGRLLPAPGTFDVQSLTLADDQVRHSFRSTPASGATNSTSFEPTTPPSATGFRLPSERSSTNWRLASTLADDQVRGQTPPSLRCRCAAPRSPRWLRCSAQTYYSYSSRRSSARLDQWTPRSPARSLVSATILWSRRLVQLFST